MKSSQVKQRLRALTLLLALVLLASTTWFAAPHTAQASESEIYSATLTAGGDSSARYVGFNNVSGATYGTLSPQTFSHDGTTYTIQSLYINIEGRRLFFKVNTPLPSSARNVLTLIVGDTNFALRDGHDRGGGLYSWSNFPSTWSVGDTVSVKMSVTVRVAKPSGFSATAGVNQVTLSWNESGDSTITKYQVQRDGGDWTDITGSGRSTTGHTVTGLDNGTEYSFAIRAVNRAGNGVASDTVTATPFVSPVLTLSADSTAVSEDPAASIESNAPDNPGEKVTVTVTLDPAPTGGNRYEDCNLRAAATGSSAGADDYFIPAKGKHLIARFGWTQTFNFWVIDDAFDDDDETLVLEAFCTGLSAGNPPPVAPEDLQTTQLTFTIADNDVFAPAQPTDFTAIAGDTEVTLSWADPSDGTITSYQYRQSDDGGINWDPDWTAISGSGATTTGHTLSGLTNGTEYSFQIRAVNEIGAGTESDTESATPLPPLPAEPTGAALIIGDGQATLSWNDPGDSTITKYQYRLVSLGTWYDVPDSAPGGANAASYTITGLTNGTEYAFYLRAVNIAGESGVATLGFARAGAPQAPGDFVVTAGDGEAALSWSAPANNGAAISGYRYQWIVGGTSGSGWIDIPDSAVGGANAIAYTVTGLTNGTTYRFSVRAVNSRGEGRVSLQKNAPPRRSPPCRPVSVPRRRTGR